MSPVFLELLFIHSICIPIVGVLTYGWIEMTDMDRNIQNELTGRPNLMTNTTARLVC
jgi:hypothetical protein